MTSSASLAVRPKASEEGDREPWSWRERLTANTAVTLYLGRALGESLAGLLSSPFRSLKEDVSVTCQDTPLNKYLIEQMPAVRSYSPTPWAPGPISQTVLGLAINSGCPVYQRRDLLTASDGVELLIDWKEESDLPDSAPIVLIMHGIGGGSDSRLACHLTDVFSKIKWRAAVFNRRGHGESSVLPGPLASVTPFGQPKTSPAKKRKTEESSITDRVTKRVRKVADSIVSAVSWHPHIRWQSRVRFRPVATEETTPLKQPTATAAAAAAATAAAAAAASTVTVPNSSPQPAQTSGTHTRTGNPTEQILPVADVAEAKPDAVVLTVEELPHIQQNGLDAGQPPIANGGLGSMNTHGLATGVNDSVAVQIGPEDTEYTPSPSQPQPSTPVPSPGPRTRRSKAQPQPQPQLVSSQGASPVKQPQAGASSPAKQPASPASPGTSGRRATRSTTQQGAAQSEAQGSPATSTRARRKSGDAMAETAQKAQGSDKGQSTEVKASSGDTPQGTGTVATDNGEITALTTSAQNSPTVTHAVLPNGADVNIAATSTRALVRVRSSKRQTGATSHDGNDALGQEPAVQPTLTAPQLATGTIAAQLAGVAATGGTEGVEQGSQGGEQHGPEVLAQVRRIFPRHSDTDDLSEVVAHIQRTHPGAPIVALGFSQGSNSLVHFLGQLPTDQPPPFRAAISVSNAYDLNNGTLQLSKDWVTDAVVTRPVKRLLRKELTAVRRLAAAHGLQLDLGKALAANSIREFDAALLSLWGYASVEDYYAEMSSQQGLHDDPIIHPSLPNLAKTAAQENPWLIAACTQRGGHLGWLQGWSGSHWLADVITQYAQAAITDTAQTLATAQSQATSV